MTQQIKIENMELINFEKLPKEKQENVLKMVENETLSNLNKMGITLNYDFKNLKSDVKTEAETLQFIKEGNVYMLVKFTKI